MDYVLGLVMMWRLIMQKFRMDEYCRSKNMCIILPCLTNIYINNFFKVVIY